MSKTNRELYQIGHSIYVLFLYRYVIFSSKVGENMARLSKEELKRKHLSELNVARVRRFREKNPIKHFDVVLNYESYEQINTALKNNGLTKTQFFQDAIDKFLKGE